MRRSSLTLLLTVALVAAACGSEPKDLIVGDDAASMSQDDAGPVADDSPPRFDEFCVIGQYDGPLDPTDVLVTSFGGRWGELERGVESGRAETGFDTLTDERPECLLDEVLADCLALTAYMFEVGATARVNAIDEDTRHELVVSASSVGPDAQSYARAINNLAAMCPRPLRGALAMEFSEFESAIIDGVEAAAGGELVWITALARENVLVVVMAGQLRDVLFDESHLADFERVVGLTRQELESAPLS